MVGISSPSKGETFTFRLDPLLKLALTRSAAEDHIQPAELMRTLVKRYLAEREQHEFESEARRQSLSIAQRALDPGSDEARVMAEISADLELDPFADEWKP